ECQPPLCRSFDPERFLQFASWNLCSPELSQADERAAAVHLKWPIQFARARNRSPKLNSFSPRLLQLRRQLANEVLDLLGVVPVANQNRVASAHNNQIVHADQCHRRLTVIENDIVAGIECG